MDRTLDLARQKGGRWVALQVEADNEPALALYDRLAFTRYETLHHWRAFRVKGDVPANPAPLAVRPRRPGESAAEADLVFNRTRRGGMAWTRTIAASDVSSGGLLSQIVDTSYREHWVLPAPDRSGRLAGTLWVQASGLSQPRLTLFLDPDLHDPNARLALLRHAFTLSALRGRALWVETTGDDPVVADFLETSGFRRIRSLVQMRKPLLNTRTP
jgi:ribosomal protein S18 acetylase RimI-like enzyme